MTYDTCDRCGQPLVHARLLFVAVPATNETLIGQYGRACAAAITAARAGHNERTFDQQGRELSAGGQLL